MASWIAERALILVDPASGTRRPLTIRIGAPERIQDSEAFGCAVQLDGLIGSVGPIQGVDAFQALEEACRFVQTYLSMRRDIDDLQWPTGDRYFDD